MAVITISREAGCSGSQIAEKTARLLGYHLADQETFRAILDQYGFVQFREFNATPPTFWSRFDDQASTMISIVSKVTLALAQHGNIVILGRCGYSVLSGYSDVLNVRIQAPFRYRVMKYMEQRGIAEYEEAEKAITDGDKLRISYVEAFCKTKWDSAKAFDLVLDESKIPEEMAVNWILETTKKIVSDKGKKEPLISSVNIDSVMQSAVCEVLKCRDRGHKATLQ